MGGNITTTLLAGQARARFSHAAGLQAMQLVKLHPSYNTAVARVSSMDTGPDAESPECRVLTFYDGAATPGQRWSALKPFMDFFEEGLLQRFNTAWTPDAVAFFSQQVGTVVAAARVVCLNVSWLL